MASSLALQIEILTIPEINDIISITYDNTNTITHVWKTTRTGAGEVTIGQTVEQCVTNYRAAINSDANPPITIGSFSGNKLALIAFGHIFTDANYTGKGLVNFFFFNPTQVINVSPLSECMYINNDIIVTLSGSGDIGYFIVKLTNISNGNIVSTNLIISQGLDGLATINLSPIIKSMFRSPKHTLSFNEIDNQIGSDLFRISIRHSSSDAERVLRRYFIRGGIKSNKTNINAVRGSILSPTEKIPYWSGYPFGFSYLTNSGYIQYQNNNSSIPENRKDNRRVSNCNPVYIKFLNQLGGYSFWLFDGYGKTDTNKNLGSYIEYNNIPTGQSPVLNSDYTDLGDFGNTIDSKMYASGKIPEAYLKLIQDLIISPEIYLYDVVNEYTRVTCASNSITEEPNKRAYNVKINFDLNYRFNPSLLWSN